MTWKLNSWNLNLHTQSIDNMYPDGFVNELKALSKKKQFLFGLCNAERLLHFYEEFEEEWEVNQPFATLSAALELGYQYVVESSPVTVRELAQAMDQVESAIPDNDEYDGSTEVTYAQNAALALYCTLKYAVQGRNDSLLEACGKTIETIDSIELDRVNDESFDTRPIIDQEIALQLDYLEYIDKMSLSEKSILSVRQLNQQNIIVA